jgi:hypothetical protein
MWNTWVGFELTTLEVIGTDCIAHWCTYISFNISSWLYGYLIKKQIARLMWLVLQTNKCLVFCWMDKILSWQLCIILALLYCWIRNHANYLSSFEIMTIDFFIYLFGVNLWIVSKLWILSEIQKLHQINQWSPNLIWFLFSRKCCLHWINILKFKTKWSQNIFPCIENLKLNGPREYFLYREFNTIE